MLQTVPIPSNHACNRIGSNYNVQRDRRQFFLCKKAGYGTRDRCDNFRSRRGRRRSCHFASSHSTRSLFDSFEMHCRKTRSTRGQCESNIGKQFFSEKNFSAAFQDFGPYWLVLRHPRTAPPFFPSFADLYSLSSLPPACPPSRSCSASVVPAHFLRTTFKPRSFLAIKECPRSFAVTYGCAGNNDKR